MTKPPKPPSASLILAPGSGRRGGAPAWRRAWRLIAAIAAGVLAGCGGEQKTAGGGGSGAGARRPATPPGGAAAPAAATGKAPAHEAGGGAEAAIEPAPLPARPSDRPDWWMDQPVVTDGSYVGTFEATAPSLRQARQTALDNAHVAVRTSLGREPVKFEVQPTWSARRADGSYRVCVKVAAEAAKAP